ncbi:FUSC family protein [Mycolicibacterium agri]|uniref:Fusaric acid resistance protein n=1 Tax=Mycolicibacterium agri TaxID=36811 RepID=A0A7I9VTY3_MYCAG|nr:FUSC family protein [Mycolicibacterium agri]GFG48760.1 fusaric acid resistance protein [Mycolicibacterium agri]
MSNRQALRLAVPNHGAVARSLLAVFVLAAVALYFGPAGAATSTAAAGAIAGAIALQDNNPIGRIPVVLAVSVQLGAAVLIGSLASSVTLVFIGVIALWCFVAGMQWAVGAPAGLIAGAASLLLVIQQPASAWAAAVSALFALLAGLTQAALIAVRPPRRWRREREALSKVYRSLSADARRLATDPDAKVDSSQLLELKEAFSNDDTAPSRPTPAYRDWHALPDQIAKTLMALRGKADGHDAIRDLLTAAADTLAAIAEQSRAARRDAEYALKGADAAATSVTMSEAAVAQRLSRQLHRADGLRFGRRRLSDWTAAVRRAAALTYSHLNTKSPIARHAVRLAGAAAAGTALARFAEVPAGHWIPLTVLLVTRPETAHTYTRCVGRVAAICVGVVVASALTALWHPTGLAAALLAVAFLALTHAVAAFGFIATTAGFAATIASVLDISGTPPASVSDVVFAVAIGGALAVLAHVLVPDDALIRLRQRAGELLKTEIDYAATVIKAFVHDLENPSDTLAAAWQRAFRARAAFEAAAGATRIESRELRRWMRSYRAGLNAVTSSCAALEANLPAHPSETLGREFVLAVDEFVEVLRGDPPTPAAPWSVDTEQLAVAERQLREAAAQLASDESAARALVAEIGAITRSLADITVDERDRAAS